MRSEKEIKEKLQECLDHHKICKNKQIADNLMSSIWAFRFSLQGEPRYSVAELEKIEKAWDRYEADDFVEFLKDRKKVEEILTEARE